MQGGGETQLHPVHVFPFYLYPLIISLTHARTHHALESLLGSPITWNMLKHMHPSTLNHICLLRCFSDKYHHECKQPLGPAFCPNSWGGGGFFLADAMWRSCSIKPWTHADLYEYTLQDFPNHRVAFICPCWTPQHLVSSFPFSLGSFTVSCVSSV